MNVIQTKKGEEKLIWEAKLQAVLNNVQNPDEPKPVTPNLNHKCRSPLGNPGKSHAEVTAPPTSEPVEYSAKCAWMLLHQEGRTQVILRIRAWPSLSGGKLHMQGVWTTLLQIFLFIRTGGCWKSSVCSLKVLVFLNETDNFFPQLWGSALNICHTNFSPQQLVKWLQ